MEKIPPSHANQPTPPVKPQEQRGMIIKYANFLGSFTTLAQCPPPAKPEYAFIGRSNVGKSSLINMLTGRNSLAHVSHTPGKTQTLNFYHINESWYLVDLPGYGFAKVSKTKRQEFEQMLRRYLQKRDNLQCVFLLVDSRIPPQQSDLDFANWLGEMMIPFVFVFTKTDDRAFKPVNIDNFKQALLETWNEMPQYFITSSRRTTGKAELLSFINGLNKQFAP